MTVRVRIEDVARAAGVSMKTVSRVLNNEATVRDDTRSRVQEVAKALNYRPDPSARSLAGRKSYLVALLYDNPSANYLMEILMGVVEACQAHHYGMVVQPLLYDSPDFVETVISLVSFSRFDGLILTPPITDSVELLDRLDELAIPYACISPKNREGRIGVTLEEHDAVSDMVAHLVSLGHTRIAHIKGHTAHGASEWRLAGYRAGLRRTGLRYDPALVIEGEFSFDSGVRAGHVLLDLPEPPTAIFAANDDMAAGVMSVAHGRGLRIPDDISVCGFDNTPMSRQIFPALTTVHQPTQDMGRQATLELLKAIRDPASGEMVRMPYALQLRQSTGSAPRRP
ncbi:LacI family DNA-binding transcriptional regulator [Pseudoxanthomonas putridarboris]|uniref:LacI family DNA-binding transcriptional regulator n=1 Tax=Pseudoxanthomonas putridarboris TaxID=752605 RepID=A0ABU9IXS7_9GAMM